MRIRFSLLLLFTTILASCSSAPVKVSTVQEGQWRGKALIKDLEQSHSYIVNLNFNAKRGDVTRMDVTTTLGTGVASLLLNPEEVRYIVLDQKKFYFGQPQPAAMKPILSIPFDPRWLQNLLFETPLPAPEWNCQRDNVGALKTCDNSDLGLKITWSSRARDKRTVLIEHAKASVQINFQSFKPKVEERKNLFSLDPLESFQKIHLN